MIGQPIRSPLRAVLTHILCHSCHRKTPFGLSQAIERHLPRQAVPPNRVPLRGLLCARPLGLGSPLSGLLRSPISFDSLAPAWLNGTLPPQSRAALTGLPLAISSHLFQEIWFTQAGWTFVQSTQAVPTAMCSPVADLLRLRGKFPFFLLKDPLMKSHECLKVSLKNDR